jgi:hypothetical protein
MLHELKQRLTLPTPAFWKKVQRRSAATAASFTALTVTLASLATHLPSGLAFLTTAAAVAAAFFGGIAAICSLAVDDPSAIAAPTDPTATS